MPPILVVDPDWYVRAQLRLMLDDAGYPSAELAEVSLLWSLLQVSDHPLMVIGRAHCLLPLPSLHYPTLPTRPTAFVLFADEQDAPWSQRTAHDHTIILPLPIERETLLSSVTQAALRMHTMPCFTLPIRLPETCRDLVAAK